MAQLSPEGAFDTLKDRVAGSVAGYFPYEGRKNRLELNKVWVDDNRDVDDIRSQKKARLAGRSWTVPVRADVSLVDKKTGRVIDRSTVKVSNLPKITRRYSYIVDGNEWQVDNQLRLKSGAYHRKTQSGELESHWNAAKGAGFRMKFDPASRRHKLEYGTAKNIALYPILKSMGVADDDIERAWGKEIFKANKSVNETEALNRFHKTVTGKPAASPEEARELVRSTLGETQLYKDTTKRTLGKSYDTVTGGALLRSSSKLLGISRGTTQPDDRESLEFKEIHSVEDLVSRKVENSQRDIKRKLNNNVDRKKKVREIVTPDIFNRPVKSFFTSSSLSHRPDQTNPLEFVSGQTRTTVLGEGGISDINRVVEEAKLINPSSLGFLDPIQTPECYAEGTQVYTSEGWKDWRHVTDSTLFACRVGGRLDFHAPSALVGEHYSGPMYGLKAGKIEYLVTPNHRVLFNTVWHPDVWRIDRADRVHGKERGFTCVHGAYEGDHTSDVKTFDELGKGSNSQVHVDEVDLLDWAELLGWYLAEGSHRYVEEKYAYQVRISQSEEASPENYQQIADLMDRLPWESSEDFDRRGFTIGTKQLASYVRQFGLCDEKFIPAEAFEWSVEARETLMETLLQGDGRIGSKRSNGRSYNQRVFTTTSPRLADDFEMLAMGLGLSTSHKVYPDNREERYLDVHEIRILVHGLRYARPKHPNYPAKYWKQDYDGRVYCATVPGGLLYVRYGKGIGFWSGNSAKVGVNLQLALGSEKKGNRLVSRAYDVKKGKMVNVPAATLQNSVVAYPDQVRWSKKKALPRKRIVAVSDKGGDIAERPWKDVDYVLPSTKGLFGMTANTVPFLQSTSGVRAGMATRQAEQAIPLVHREAPLVQVKTESKRTFEDVLGRFNSHQTPISGKVTKVKKDGIVVKGKDGKSREVQIYDDFPLNNDSSVLNSTPLVKAGDEVKKGQTIADTNFTRNGTLALGTNLKVGYMPYKGYNFEDGIVVSETAAEKLTSEHMHRKSQSVDRNVVMSKRKFLASMPTGVLTPQQREKLDDDSVVKPGTKIEHGDVLVGALRKRELTKEEKMLSRLSKAIVSPYRNEASIWDKDTPGEVVKVVKGARRTTVYVKTEEPAKIGDKLVGRHANKGIITKIVPDHEMPKTTDGAHIEVVLNPNGVPCYDEETEFLTQRGWVFGRDIDLDDRCGTLNTETFQFEWQCPEEVHNYSYDGKMYQIQNQQLDLLVTPNHRMFSARRRKILGGPLDLDDPEIRSCFTLDEAKDVVGEPRRYLKSALWEGTDTSLSFVHIDRGSRGVTGRPSRGFNVYPRDWAEFMGWFLAEGSTYFTESNYGYFTEISQNREKNPENYQQICELLDRMGISHAQEDTGVRIRHKGLYEKLHPLGGSNDKYVPRDVLDLPRADLTTLLDAYVKGDGHETWNEETGHYGTLTCSTNSRRLADGVQEIAIKLGMAANIKEDKRPEKYRGGRHYILNLSGSRYAPWVNWDKITKLHQKEGMTYYKGRVYCVTVPNGVVMVRRNGKHVFCGNSRMNPSQIMETAAAKIADKTGQTYVVDNFSPLIPNYTQKVKDDLAAQGLVDKEPMHDGITGERLGNVMVGKQYMYKLHHQVDKKLSARAGGVGYPYDVNQIPKGGGPRGAKSLGSLGLYSMLSHGSRENIREMMTYKGNRNDELWTAIQNDEPLPPPRPPYAMDKLKGYLNVMGVNVEKKGNSLNLVPFTDKDVKTMSNGRLPDAGKTVRGKDLAPQKGGLFDPFLTGGPGGTKWTHIELQEPMPNPIFEKPILSLTGMKRREFNAVMAAETRIGGKTSGMAIKAELDKIDVDKELKSTEEALPRLKGPALDRANKKVKYLRALKKVGMKPSEAYMNRNVPVLPPSMRPVSALDNGELNYDDTNGLYKQIALIDQKMRGMDKALPDEEKDNLRKEMYDGLKALQMNGGVIRGKEHRGVMGMIAGDQPKRGFFQDKITARQQDMSLRSTIIPEPSLSLDEVGLPRKAAMGTYKPFVVQYMHRNMGFTPLDAQKAIKANHPAANRALEKVVAERPILLKRDPALHKHNVMAFKPKLVSGKAIRIHPLVTGGFNADFDGDTMVGFVPVSTKAVDESYKMLPSKNLFSETHGRAMHVPGQDSLLGLYDMTAMGKRTRATFADEKAVLEARKAGRIGTTDVVRMAGKPTTAGRVQVAQTLPGKLATRTQVLHDPKFQLKKKNLAAVITDAARNTPNDFSGVADGLKDTGDAYAYQTAPSIGLDDISPHIETKNRALADAEKRIALYKGKDKERYSLNEYARAMDQIEKKVKPQIAKDNTALYTMMDSGARGNWDQIRQMVAAPVLVKDPQNKVVPFPIKTGFSEGMQIADYWTQMHGVRKGEVGKVISTQRPGSMTKNLVNANMNQLAVDKDCGTSRGVMMKVDDREVLDRHLAAPVSLRKGEVLPRNTVVTPGVVTRLKNSKKSKIPVRSPLKCEHGDGICPQCYGLMADGRLPEPGTNLGVISSQAMGEPATQLALNTFHTGGVATPSEARGTTSSDKFARVEQLLAMPKTLPGSATLATANGPVDRVRKDPAGGFEVIVGGQRHYVPKDRGLLPGVRRGKKVKKGTRLSHGPVNPRELLDLTNVDTVRNYLTDELYDAYKDNGPVRRKNFEVVVRGMTNLTQVRDPGDNPNYLRGDVVPATRVAAENRASKGRPVRHAPLLKGIADVPRDSFEDWVARMQHTKLKSTLIDAASQGWSSDVHGMHPIPAVAYGAEFGKPKGKVPANLEFVY